MKNFKQILKEVINDGIILKIIPNLSNFWNLNFVLCGFPILHFLNNNLY
jgi:hypothetical protein